MHRAQPSRATFADKPPGGAGVHDALFGAGAELVAFDPVGVASVFLLVERFLICRGNLDEIVYQDRQSMLAIDALPGPQNVFDVEPYAVPQEPEVLHDGLAGSQPP